MHGVTDLASYWPRSILKAHQGLDLGFFGGCSWGSASTDPAPNSQHLFCVSRPVHFSISNPETSYEPHPPFSGDFAMALNCARWMHFLESPWARIPAFQLILCGLKSVSSYYSNFLLSGLSPSVTCRFVHHKNGTGAKNGINRSKWFYKLQKVL